MLERDYQAKLIKRLEYLLPGCIVMKNDPNYIQGIPDLTILYKNRWAVLEVKKSARASLRPNQEYFIERMDDMSFASVIYPENETEVLNDLQRSLCPVR